MRSATNNTSAPRIVIAVVLLVALMTGCSRSVTAPPTAADARRPTEVARLVDASQLGVDPGVPIDSLEAVFRAQNDIETTLVGRDPDVLGTATSFLGGRPVVVALTRRATHRIPAMAGGRNVVELALGDVEARSTYCGTSTGRNDQCNAGTLGAIVTDGVRNYWLSNWHVFVRTTGKIGDAIDAPGRLDAGCNPTPIVGNITRFVPVRFDGSANTVDCAIARLASGVSVSPLEAAGASTFLPSGTIRTASIGLAVKKVGRTTGLTSGSVTAINASMPVSYKGIGTAQFRGVVIFNLWNDGGDSGSLIVSASGNNPVALLFAGSTSGPSNYAVGCPIGAVYQAIGAHVAN